MPLPRILSDRLRLPVIGAPMFIVSGPELVIAQCKAGVVGSFPALNARPQSLLDEWLDRITTELAEHDAKNPDAPAAPFAVNQIVHKTNDRLEGDMELCVKYKAPIIITSLGARPEVNDAAHGAGGIVLHDVINDRFARKAVDKGADGLIAVAAGADHRLEGFRVAGVGRDPVGQVVADAGAVLLQLARRQVAQRAALETLGSVAGFAVRAIRQEDLLVADVGQNLWEEINLLEKGGNYGWNLREGMHRFTEEGREGDDEHRGHHARALHQHERIGRRPAESVQERVDERGGVGGIAGTPDAPADSAAEDGDTVVTLDEVRAVPDTTHHAGTIVEVASENGSFETLVKAVQAAGLVETLNGDGPFTVFAPTDEAFSKLPEGALEDLLANEEQLQKVLTYHVVPGRVTAADVEGLNSAETVAGESLQISTEYGSVKVGDATVVQADVMASNECPA